jgi:hypothetical protein
MKLFKSTGKLLYVENKLILEIDKELSKYYFSLVPKSYKLNPQKYDPHISVVRNEIPPRMEYWYKYQNEFIDFLYEPYVYSGPIYYWLNTFSNRLEEIRLELGLPVSSEYTRPPGGFFKCFHTTIGNVKSI